MSSHPIPSPSCVRGLGGTVATPGWWGPLRRLPSGLVRLASLSVRRVELEASGSPSAGVGRPPVRECVLSAPAHGC
eukprot:1916996-Prymnesium_polylepis.4